MADTGNMQGELERMEEKEFFEKLKGSLIILSTSSLDKITDFTTLFGSLGMGNKNNEGKNGKSGIDAYFTDIGRFGDVASKTPEDTHSYAGNGQQKYEQQCQFLRENEKELRSRIVQSNGPYPKGVRMVGMTEDSGWEVLLPGATNEQKIKFIESIEQQIKPLMRQKDFDELVADIKQAHDKPNAERDPDGTGFPGPNLRPIQEHIGGFDVMMKVIYNAAKDAGIEKMRYRNTSAVSFVFPQEGTKGKVFTKVSSGYGSLLTQQEYEEGKGSLPKDRVLNTDFVQIADGQKNGARRNYGELMQKGLLTIASTELPGDDSRRKLTEWLQQGIGYRTSSAAELERAVTIGLMSPEGVDVTKIGEKGKANTSLKVFKRKRSSQVFVS